MGEFGLGAQLAEQIAQDHRLPQDKCDHRRHGQRHIPPIRIRQVIGYLIQVFVPEHIPKGQGQNAEKENRTENSLARVLCHAVTAPFCQL